ncbi:MAG: LLM class flavin-dependent oxidoreductase [Gammaproteobacteria bacterium]|nr:LLM class flavin-dependent oxidoreductase [Gammaproteobacteria bacterium]
MRIHVILDPDLSPQRVTELGLLAEACGLDAVWSSNYPNSRDPFINLCPLALASSRIRLGPLVITPYELHPYKIAKALASLNELCRGRANILIGGPTGVNAFMGMDTSRMVGRVRECMEILKGISPDAPLNYQGKIFQTWGYQPRWATDEPPQIYVGANKVQMLRMATGIADKIMLGDTTAGRLASSMQLIRDNLRAHGRSREDVRISALVAWHVKADRAASFSEARSQLALRGMLDTWYLESFLTAEECRVVEANRNSFFKAYKQQSDRVENVPDSILDKLVANLTMSGDHADLDRHIETLRRYGDLGLDEVAFKLHQHPEAAIRTIGSLAAAIS